MSSLCRPGSVPSYVNGFGGTLAVTSPVPYLHYNTFPIFGCCLFGDNPNWRTTDSDHSQYGTGEVMARVPPKPLT